MSCEQWSEAISALADGEDPGVNPDALSAHIAGCPDCQAMQTELERLRPKPQLAPATTMPDLSPRVVRLNAMADRASRWWLVRVALGLVATYLLVDSSWRLLVADGEVESVHAARHLGAFTLAYAVCLLVVVVRPARARTVLPVATTLAGALLLAAAVDVIDGRAGLLTETLHLPEILSLGLVWLLAMPALHSPPPGSASRSPHQDADEPALRLVERPTTE